MRVIRIACLVLVIASAATVYGQADPCDFTWVGPAGGNWGAPQHWNPSLGAPPGAGDVVCINSQNYCRIYLADRAAAVLRIENGSALIIREGRTLTLDAAGHGASTLLDAPTGQDNTLKVYTLMQDQIPFVGGIVFGSDFEFNGDGSIEFETNPEESAAAFPCRFAHDGTDRKVTIGQDLTVAGNVRFTTTIKSDADFVVQEGSDHMFFGAAADPITPTLSGDFTLQIVEDETGFGTIVFENVRFDTGPGDTWDAQIGGGTFQVASTCATCDVMPGTFTFTGGVLDIDANMCSTGTVTYNNCGVALAPNTFVRFKKRCP